MRNTPMGCGNHVPTSRNTFGKYVMCLVKSVQPISVVCSEHNFLKTIDMFTCIGKFPLPNQRKMTVLPNSHYERKTPGLSSFLLVVLTEPSAQCGSQNGSAEVLSERRAPLQWPFPDPPSGSSAGIALLSSGSGRDDP